MAYTPKENLILSGDARAVTASPGDADTSISTTGFVSAAITAAAAGYVHLSGTETITGTKTFSAAPSYAVQTFVASGTISSTGGSLVTFTGATLQTLTLPTAAVGMFFVVSNIDPDDKVNVAISGSDTINEDSVTFMNVNPGESLVFQCIAANKWVARSLGKSGRARQSFTASGSISSALGELVTFTGAASQTLTLPLVESATSIRFTIMNIDATNSVLVARASTDLIDGAATSITLLPGETLQVWSTGGLGWKTFQVTQRGTMATIAYVNSVAVATPTGAIMDYAGTAAPSGWQLCSGAAISRTTFAALFAVIGTTFGAGDGSTTFNLPDARGRTAAGKDDMGGTAASRLTGGATLGAAGGAEAITLTGAQSGEAGHTHANTLAASQGTHTHADTLTWLGSSGTGSNTGVAAGPGQTSSVVTNSVGGAITAASAGAITISGSITAVAAANAASSHSNLQPYIVFNKIIKT